MTLSRVVRGSLGLAAVFAVLLAPGRALAAGFTSTLPHGQLAATGLDEMNADQLALLDVLVAGDLANARQLKIATFGERFSDRHRGQWPALDQLDGDAVARLDELVADAIAAQPLPKERPRLKDNEVVSLQRRLQVHGGMSFTLGWASGGRDFREAGAWVSYFDPVTGLGLAFAFSQYSGDAIYPYGYYYPYAGGYPGDPTGWYGGAPGDTFSVGLSWTRPNFALGIGFSETDFSHPAPFNGSGAALRGPVPRRF
jgi:hypothetical protein